GLTLTGGTANVVVEHNTITGGARGLAASGAGATNLQVRDNRLAGSTTGIALLAAADGRIAENDVTANGTALDLSGGAADSLVSWWRGEGNANDSSGAHHGALQNGAGFGAGQFGQAFSLDGVNDFVQVPDSAAWSFGSKDFTIELWANLNVVRSGSPGSLPNVFIAQDEGGGGTNKWIFFHDGSGFGFHINGPSVGSVFLGPIPFALTAGQWHQLAVTRSGSTYTFYADGAAVGSATDVRPIPDANAPLTIGQAEGVGFINGRLDEAAIFSRALSAQEIQALFTSQDSLVNPPAVVSAMIEH